ncbi:hypothetical protein SELMODRAFT_441093 [Selaginella moellendorffii]|uniref:F-box domain-containing protein n=1 Tax=Selaginella moellendorffii TaxID=88036 RepID=D8RGE5_SELML|nr:hypothetical protein SELMODRAFT_441093 [Selaginella moellendorffii]
MFPADVEDRILVFLHVKALLRARSVCHRWKVVIDSKEFAKAKVETSRQHPLVLECTQHVQRHCLSLRIYNPFTGDDATVLPLPDPDFLPNWEPVASAGGLLCFSDRFLSGAQEGKFGVWNPLKRNSFVELPGISPIRFKANMKVSADDLSYTIYSPTGGGIDVFDSLTWSWRRHQEYSPPDGWALWMRSAPYTWLLEGSTAYFVGVKGQQFGVIGCELGSNRCWIEHEWNIAPDNMELLQAIVRHDNGDMIVFISETGFVSRPGSLERVHNFVCPQGSFRGELITVFTGIQHKSLYLCTESLQSWIALRSSRYGKKQAFNPGGKMKRPPMRHKVERPKKVIIVEEGMGRRFVNLKEVPTAPPLEFWRDVPPAGHEFWVALCELAKFVKEYFAMEDCAMTTVRAQAPLVRGYMAMLPKALVSLMQEARCRDKEFWPDDYKLVDIAKRMCDKYDAMIPPEIAVQPKHVEEEDFTAKEYPYRACKILRGFLGERTIQLHVPQPETAFYDDNIDLEALASWENKPWKKNHILEEGQVNCGNDSSHQLELSIIYMVRTSLASGGLDQLFLLVEATSDANRPSTALASVSNGFFLHHCWKREMVIWKGGKDLPFSERRSAETKGPSLKKQKNKFLKHSSKKKSYHHSSNCWTVPYVGSAALQ